MPRPARLLAVALGVVLALASPLEAQRRPAIQITLPPRGSATAQGPIVRALDMLGGAKIRELLLASFPARFHFRVELWSEGRFFNGLERAAEYDVVVRYISIEQRYEVIQRIDDKPFSLGKFAKVEDAESAIARATRVNLVAVRSARPQYYQVTLSVEVLSASDLDDVERWLKGVEPVVTGGSNPAGAFARGVKGIFVRLLGGEKREYEGKSETFKVQP